MAGLYGYLVDAGYSADYLDRCTIHDIDLFATQTNERRKKQGWNSV